MIIDFHTHCFPDKIAKKAMMQLSAAANFLHFHTDGTVGGLQGSMEMAGIQRSVIAHIATKPAQTPAVNRWAAEVNSDSIISFGSIHPEYPAWKDEVAFMADAGIRGIKFHPDYQDFTVDEKRIYPLYEAVANAGLVMLFHAGLDLGYPPPYKCMPDKLKNVIADFPGALIVAAHMGAYNYWSEVEEYLLGKQLYFDTSYCTIGMAPEHLTRLIKLHGVSKVLFGSDSPWAAQGQEVEKIRALGLDAAETEAILGGNAARLLGL